jgi:very-short-patch-repair endonuclease
MFTSVFKGRTVAFASEAPAARIALIRLLQSRKLKPHRFLHKDMVGIYEVEFVCHEGKLAIELSQRGATNRELERARHLHELGYRTLRVLHADLLARPDRVLSQIRAVLADTAGRPPG